MFELANLIIENLRDAIFPHRCVCGKWGTVLCDNCKSQLSIKKTEVCPLCKKISPNGKTCDSCRYKSGLTGVMVAGNHEGVLKGLIWKFKYGPIKDTAYPLADIFFEKYGQFLINKKPVITFVPTSQERLRLRGYNQAEELAKLLSKRTGLKEVNILKRPKDVLHQVGLTRKERLINAKGTIKYIGQKAGSNKKIVVIDDVYTTGATLEECAKVLRENGYKEVWGMVLSRD